MTRRLQGGQDQLAAAVAVEVPEGRSAQFAIHLDRQAIVAQHLRGPRGQLAVRPAEQKQNRHGGIEIALDGPQDEVLPAIPVHILMLHLIAGPLSVLRDLPDQLLRGLLLVIALVGLVGRPRANRLVHLQVEGRCRPHHPMLLAYLPRRLGGRQAYGPGAVPGAVGASFIQDGTVFKEDGEGVVGVLPSGSRRHGAKTIRRKDLGDLDERAGGRLEDAVLLPEIDEPRSRGNHQLRARLRVHVLHGHPGCLTWQCDGLVGRGGKAGRTLPVDQQLVLHRQQHQ